MTGKHGKHGKGMGKGTIIALLVVGILGGSYLVWGGITGDWLLWWEPAPVAEPEAALTFSILDRGTRVELDAAAAAVYGATKTGLTQAEIDALQGDDFTALGTNATGEGFTPDVDLLYVVIVTCVGYCDQELILDTTPGTVTVLMIPAATNASILAISSTLKTNLRDDGVNTTANTTEVDWTLYVQPLDDGGLANDSLGFGPFCNFIAGGIDLADFATYTNQFLLEITFRNPANGLALNADVDWITVSGVAADVTNDTASLFILVNADVIGRTPISIVFDDGIGVSYNVAAACAGFGDPSGYTPFEVLA